MFLTASPLMGRWIVASCEIYVGIRVVINDIGVAGSQSMQQHLF